MGNVTWSLWIEGLNLCEGIGSSIAVYFQMHHLADSNVKVKQPKAMEGTRHRVVLEDLTINEVAGEGLPARPPLSRGYGFHPGRDETVPIL